ncbi:TfoX/Sxy family protein [Xanthobacter sp. V3C-3]|uniref:TfoX/Sxy family protein n=1 Tax=Xanthobacter lutulentifluminis TaxID=3119935 RepID=UPI00372C548A
MDADEIADLFAAFAPVKARRMFGGSGLYAEGLMFAIEVAGTIYLKADPAFAAELERRGAGPFSYEAQGTVRTMRGFWSVPEAALDDADDLAALARRSLMLAQAAAEERPARRPSRKRAAASSGDGAAEAAERAPTAGRARRPGTRRRPVEGD